MAPRATFPTDFRDSGALCQLDDSLMPVPAACRAVSGHSDRLCVGIDLAWSRAATTAGLMPIPSGPPERRLAITIFCVDIDVLVLEQQLHNGLMPILQRPARAASGHMDLLLRRHRRASLGLEQ